MPRAELASRIEGMIGNILWNRGRVLTGPAGLGTTVTFDWDYVTDDGAMELSTLLLYGWQRAHANLDLKARASSLPDAVVEVAFDIEFSFKWNEDHDRYDLSIDVRDVQAAADLPWWAYALIAYFCGVSNYTSGSCVSRVEDYIAAKVEASISPDVDSIPFATKEELEAVGCTEPTVAVMPDNPVDPDRGMSVRFSCQ